MIDINLNLILQSKYFVYVSYSLKFKEEKNRVIVNQETKQKRNETNETQQKRNKIKEKRNEAKQDTTETKRNKKNHMNKKTKQTLTKRFFFA